MREGRQDSGLGVRYVSGVRPEFWGLGGDRALPGKRGQEGGAAGRTPASVLSSLESDSQFPSTVGFPPLGTADWGPPGTQSLGLRDLGLHLGLRGHF